MQKSCQDNSRDYVASKQIRHYIDDLRHGHSIKSTLTIIDIISGASKFDTNIISYACIDFTRHMMYVALFLLISPFPFTSKKFLLGLCSLYPYFCRV
jgi:hypothetical protein